MRGSPPGAPERVCISTTKGSIRVEHVIVLVDHEIGTFGDDRQLVVGDDGGDLDDDVAAVVETRHLQVHPHEHDSGHYRWHDDRSDRCDSSPSTNVRPRGGPVVTAFGRALAVPGAVERVELRSAFGFMAFHGGALERQTDRIATAARDLAAASLYVVAHPDPIRRTSRPPRRAR